jgi:hypothetical protein
MAVGTIHYGDYRNVRGVQVSFDQIVTIGSPRNALRPLDKHYFHRLTVKETACDSVPKDQVLLDSTQDEGSDRKPHSHS